MNKMKNLTLAALVMVIAACSNEVKSGFDGNVMISGKLENTPKGHLVLSKYLEDRVEPIDTIEVKNNGAFEYTLELDGPTFYELDLYGEKQVKLALYDEDLEVKYDFDQEGSLELEGSFDTKQVLKVDELAENYQKDINDLNAEYYQALSKKDESTVKSIQQKAMELETKQSERVKETINSMEGSFASLAAIGMLNPRNDFSFVDSVVQALDEKYPETKMIVNLKQQLDEMRALSMGQPAPEISLPNPEGDTVNLSDFRGKYVLIDFWAAWCKPCRAENPNVVRLYEEYNDQGFEVFGVSLDRTKEAWEKAIEEDNLTWTQVSDLKYFNSEAASTYKINAIPATYLIDPEGKIIAKDLRGPSLENKLKEIFE
ncbi:TlpA disulfide reductase family protein [Echinicola jeungdonensis]|uniref:Redoxin domain-containing protein n=1 Tax=Echinicola jeungdonensis TaxID=709343 RepID=A0ABV5J4Z3_9BACT|nr:TlpA disulfide reductase family protein [Echinicola jeungdonensis]MDN3670599.1 TlpA disulfide reductase family protein [Echinicola jeungdonensis]